MSYLSTRTTRDYKTNEEGMHFIKIRRGATSRREGQKNSKQFRRPWSALSNTGVPKRFWIGRRHKVAA